MIYTFTGQPGAGKTVLAKFLKEYIQLNDVVSKTVFHIDGDELRNIFENKNYSREGREENIKRAYDIAKFLNHQGFDVIVSLVSPYMELREKLKSDGNNIEIYVHTTDIRGREKYYVNEYEPPQTNFIDIDTTGGDQFKTQGELIRKLRGKI